MSSAISLRLPAALDRMIRQHAANSKMQISNIVCLILEHSIGGQYSFSALRDIPQALNAKLDIRLPEKLVTGIYAESERLNVSTSVYSRTILYAYYTKRLLFVEIEGRYTLAENHDQTKSA